MHLHWLGHGIISYLQFLGPGKKHALIRNTLIQVSTVRLEEVLGISRPASSPAHLKALPGFLATWSTCNTSMIDWQPTGGFPYVVFGSSSFCARSAWNVKYFMEPRRPAIVMQNHSFLEGSEHPILSIPLFK